METFPRTRTPWVPISEASGILLEAITRIRGGEDGNRLVHIIHYPDGSVYGLSTSLDPDADLSGYTERYRSLNHYAGLI